MSNCFGRENEQSAKNICFINELEDSNFHLNPYGIITLSGCRGHGVLMIAIDFEGFMSRKQKVILLNLIKMGNCFCNKVLIYDRISEDFFSV